MSLWLPALAAPLAMSCALHRIACSRERRRLPPPGELIEIGGRRLHFLRQGEGPETVVLDAALAGTCLSWLAVSRKASSFTRVVSYDRGGFGWSDPTVAPRRVDRFVDELRRGLARASIPPPYVLVGHSYGGWIAELFASRHLEEVSGLVLVDVPHPREWSDPTEKQRLRVRRGAKLSRRAALLAHFGLTRVLFRLAARGHVPGESAPGERGRIASLLAKIPPSSREAIRSFWVRPPTLRALASLIENAPASASLVSAERKAYGDLPLVVLTASSPSPERLRDQDETARLSTRGRHLVARNSGHWIPLDEPALVVEAIREVVIAQRKSS